MFVVSQVFGAEVLPLLLRQAFALHASRALTHASLQAWHSGLASSAVAVPTMTMQAKYASSTILNSCRMVSLEVQGLHREGTTVASNSAVSAMANSRAALERPLGLLAVSGLWIFSAVLLANVLL